MARGRIADLVRAPLSGAFPNGSGPATVGFRYQSGGSQYARRYLFLQGMATQFFAALGFALTKRGRNVHRVNFSPGDRLFWQLPDSVAFRGTLGEWPLFLEQHINEWRITDIILFGDWRPLHAAAICVAALRGILVHVFEEGYLRPNWITLEQGGVNNNSSLPRDPAAFLEAAATLPPWQDGVPIEASLYDRAVPDIIYNGCNWLFGWRYPGYRSHLPVHPMRQYAGWIRRALRAPVTRRRSQMTLQSLAGAHDRFYLVPLQLDGDLQLRINSRFKGLGPAIETIIELFARHAPADTWLVLKEHPLDAQLIDWSGIASATAAQFGVTDRVLYLVGGSINDLVGRSIGVVTVNSTSGFLALALGRPVVTLARPIYDMPGLTYQAGLDRFWREPTEPDPTLFDAFRRVTVDRTQINGGFFTRQGLALAVAGAVERLEKSGAAHALTTISVVSARSSEALGEELRAEGGGD